MSTKEAWLSFYCLPIELLDITYKTWKLEAKMQSGQTLYVEKRMDGLLEFEILPLDYPNIVVV